MVIQYLSKSRIMADRQCGKRLWLETHRRDLIAYDPDVKHRLAVGEDVNTAIEETNCLLARRPGKPTFEATFAAYGVTVRRLWEYCKRDTLGMVELVKFLSRYAR